VASSKKSQRTKEQGSEKHGAEGITLQTLKEYGVAIHQLKQRLDIIQNETPTIQDIQALIARQDEQGREIAALRKDMEAFIGVAKGIMQKLSNPSSAKSPPAGEEEFDLNKLIQTFLWKEINKGSEGEDTLDHDLARLKMIAEIAQGFSPYKTFFDGIMKRVGEKIGVLVAEEF